MGLYRAISKVGTPLTSSFNAVSPRDAMAIFERVFRLAGMETSRVAWVRGGKNIEEVCVVDEAKRYSSVSTVQQDTDAVPTFSEVEQNILDATEAIDKAAKLIDGFVDSGAPACKLEEWASRIEYLTQQIRNNINPD